MTISAHCYRDMTFCSAKCRTTECMRNWTDEKAKAACIAAIPAMDPILAAYPDAMVQCIRTTVVTASPFPKHRPEELK